jgi:hypothetical protein
MSRTMEAILFAICVGCLILFVMTVSGCAATQYSNNGDTIVQKCVKDGKQLRCEE